MTAAAQPAITSVGTLTSLATSGQIIVTNADGVGYPIGIRGTTKGLRFSTSAAGTAIEGVDSTLTASYQPLNVTGSTLTLAATTGGQIVVGSSGVATTGTLSATGAATASNLSGTNTGDETLATIKTKLGVTTLSGSNTGDQTLPTTLPASDVSAWAKAAVKPTYTAAEVGLGNVPNLTFSGSNTGDQTLGSLGAQATLVSGTNIRTINGASILGSTDLVISSGTSIVLSAYDSRGDLRSTVDADGSYRLVESIGLLRFYTGSTEPDDDETCFATASGRWLLECPHWDLIEAQNLIDEDDLASRLDDIGQVLHGTSYCGITSIAAITQVSFTETLTGASVGDSVLVTPPNALTGRIAHYARVSATDVVTIYLNNPSAATATIVTGTWGITVFKDI